MGSLNVYKRRTNVVPVELGIDVSLDTLTSEIREGKNYDTPLIVTWELAFQTDGVDGKLFLTLDDSALQEITHKSGWMDIKRVTGGEPVPMFAEPLKVVFKDQVTDE